MPAHMQTWWAPIPSQMPEQQCVSKRLGSKQRHKIPRKQHQPAANLSEKAELITPLSGSLVYTAQVSVFSSWLQRRQTCSWVSACQACQHSRGIWMMLLVIAFSFRESARSRGLESIIFMGPFQFELSYDSVVSDVFLSQSSYRWNAAAEIGYFRTPGWY